MNQVSLVPPDRMGAGIDPGTPNEQAVRPPALDSNGFIFWLDEPQSWRTTSRWLRLAGWCLHVSGAPVASMRAKIGDRKFVVPLEISRPDVIDYFGRSPENDRCGFSIEVRMPRGRQILTVEAQIPESPWRIILATTVLGPLLARPGEGRRRQERDLAATIQAIAGGMIDPPTGTRPPAFFTSVAGSSMRWDCRSMAFAPNRPAIFSRKHPPSPRGLARDVPRLVICASQRIRSGYSAAPVLKP